MPDEEVLEEGVLNPVKPEIQDPLLRALLADEPAAAPVAADIPKEQPQAIAPEADEVDCVVIGLGAGGAPLLARLAMAGLKVMALEAGPWYNPEKDFATDEKAQDFLFWNDERLAAGGDPLAQEEIGYVGLADLPSWTKIGLNEKEDREPNPMSEWMNERMGE